MEERRPTRARVGFEIAPAGAGPDGVRYCAAVSLHATGGTLAEDLQLEWSAGACRVEMVGEWPGTPPTSDHIRKLTEARIERWVRERTNARRLPGGFASGVWEDEALCAQSDPEIWFPHQGEWAESRYAEAKRICSGCPVRAECLESALAFEGALDRKARFGIFGGMTANERERYSKRFRKASKEVA